MNKEEVFKKLEKYEKQLNWAKSQNFLRLSVGEFNDIASAYHTLFNTGLNQSQMTCPTCKLNATKKVAEEYFKFKMEQAKKAKEEQEKKEQEEEEKNKGLLSTLIKGTTTKKRGRKPKIDVD